MTATAEAPMFAAAPAADDVESQIVGDLLRRGIWVVPVFLLAGAIVDGWAGAASAAIGVALVVANFVAAAASLTWAARINLGLLMGVALFGYLLRIAVLFGIVLALRELVDWVHVPTLGITIVVMHLGLLLWELKYVSLSLSHPGLKPATSARKEHDQ